MNYKIAHRSERPHVTRKRDETRIYKLVSTQMMSASQIKSELGFSVSTDTIRRRIKERDKWTSPTCGSSHASVGL